MPKVAVTVIWVAIQPFHEKVVIALQEFSKLYSDFAPSNMRWDCFGKWHETLPSSILPGQAVLRHSKRAFGRSQIIIQTLQICATPYHLFS